MMVEKSTSFIALIKSVNSRSLVCGDKSVRVLIEIDSPDEKTIAEINSIHQADRMVAVCLAQVKE